MALGTREMLLVIRARDEASRVLGRLSSSLHDLDKGAAQAASDAMARGGALISLGAGITAIGGAGISLLYDMTEAAGEYETQARRALTQTADIEASLEDLKRIGRDVARDIPAPFEQMQDSLFTIFSTIETDLPGAERVLREFAKSSVAGQTDIQKVTEGSLQVLNGFRLGIDDVRRVSDVMFELVAEGVGTFEEFVTNIGKATPSAQRMGQSVEGLAGMMAFMTRNGLSGAMAATSAARAFDLMANPKVIDRMKEMGVNVKDSAGEFRPMADIVQDLSGKMATLTAPERAEALGALFKGSGNNVQARRFFDLAIPGFQQLNDLTGEMQNSSGAMERAYGIMFESPQAKAQALTNKYEAMKTEIGDRLLPVKLRLMEALSQLLDWWDKLPNGVQNGIIIFMAVGSVLMVLVGIITMLAGAFLIIQGALILAGTTFGAVAAVAGIIVLALAAVGVAIYLVIKYWDDIKAATIKAWDEIKAYINEHFGALIEDVKEFADEVWTSLNGHWEDIKEIFTNGMNKVKEEWDKWQELIEPAKNAFEKIKGWVEWGFGVLQPIFQAGLAVIKFLWDMFVEPIIDGVKMVFEGVMMVIGGAMQFIRGLIQFWLSVFTGDWSGAWEGIKTMLSGVFDMILGIIVTVVGAIWVWLNVMVLGKIIGIFKSAGSMIWKLGDNMISGLWNGMKAAWNWVWGLIKGLADDVIRPIKNLADDAINFGRNLIEGFWRGINNAKQWIIDKIKGFGEAILSGIKSFFGISSPSKVFAQLGLYTMQGFAIGIDTGAMTAVASAVHAAQAVNAAFDSTIGLGDASFSAYASGALGAGAGTAAAAAADTTGAQESRTTVPIQIYTQEINPLQHATELGDLLANRVG